MGPQSMGVFLLDGLLPDFASPVRTTASEHWSFAALFVLFILIGSITVMNMLAGMLVQVVCTIADVNQEEVKLTWVKHEILRVMRALDFDADGKLSKAEVERLMCEPEACRVIAEAGVDMVQLMELAEFHIFKDQDFISFTEFLDLVLQLRQAKAVCLRDIVHLKQFVSDELVSVEDRLLATLRPQRVASRGS